MCGFLLLISARLYPQRLPQGGVGDHCAALLRDPAPLGHWHLLVAGGQAQGNSLSSTVVDFDLNTTTPGVTAASPMVKARYNMACATNVQRSILSIYGGATNASAPVYTDVLDAYGVGPVRVATPRQNLSSPRAFLAFGSGAGASIVAGGYGSGAYHNTIEDSTAIYASTLRRPRDGLVAISYSTMGGSVVTAFAGGATPGALGAPTAVADIDLFNASNGQQAVPPVGSYLLSEARLMLCATVTADGRYVLYVGGRRNDGSPSDTIDIFDTQTNALTLILHLRTPRELCAAASYGPYVYIAGGQANRSTIYASVEIIDTRTWSLFDSSVSLPNASTSLAGVSTPFGAFFIGGYNLVDFLDTLVVYSCGDGRIDAPEEWYGSLIFHHGRGMWVRSLLDDLEVVEHEARGTEGCNAYTQGAHEHETHAERRYETKASRFISLRTADGRGVDLKRGDQPHSYHEKEDIGSHDAPGFVQSHPFGQEHVIALRSAPDS